jgi:hypothetical protein
MGHLIFTILIFIGVISVTALLFGGWLILVVVQFIRRTFYRPPAPQAVPSQGLVCPNPGCRAVGPNQARFCRRCGSRMVGGVPGVVTRWPPNRRIGASV